MWRDRLGDSHVDQPISLSVRRADVILREFQSQFDLLSQLFGRNKADPKFRIQPGSIDRSEYRDAGRYSLVTRTKIIVLVADVRSDGITVSPLCDGLCNSFQVTLRFGKSETFEPRSARA